MASRRDGGFLITSADRLSGMPCKCIVNEGGEIDILKQPFISNYIFALKPPAIFSAHNFILIYHSSF